MLKQSEKTKLYRFYVEKNFILVYFNKDEMVLYILFEISAIELIKTLKIPNLKIENKKLQKQIDLLKQSADQIKLNLIDYCKYQTDFEINFGIHNEKDILYYFTNTKCYPDVFDDK